MIKSDSIQSYVSHFEKIKNKFDIINTKFNRISVDVLKGIIENLSEDVHIVLDDFIHMITVFNSMAEGVLVLDNQETIIFLNKSGYRLFQAKEDAVHMKIDSGLRNSKIIALIQKMNKKNDRVITEEFKDDQKTNMYILFSLHPLVKSGKIVGTIIIATDITEKKENENKLKQFESIQALTALTAGIAHEIKNPLGAISIHVQLIDQEMNKCQCKQSEDIRYSLQIVNEEIERLNEIVVNFLYSVRPMNLSIHSIELTPYLDRIYSLSSLEVESKKISFIKDYEKLPSVWIDENVFKQALINLIQNSIAAVSGNENGIITIQAYKENSYVYINIRDNGTGIPDEIQPKIFDPYFTTKSYGTGLGLTIVYRIVREHKGDIYFTSDAHETVFTIRLPVSVNEKGLIEYDSNSTIDRGDVL